MEYMSRTFVFCLIFLISNIFAQNSPGCTNLVWNFSGINKMVGYTKAFTDSTIGASLTLHGFLKYGALSPLQGLANGIGMFYTVGNNIDPSAYIQISIDKFNSQVIDVITVGTGNVAIYGSNTWGGMLNPKIQTLLYTGPAGTYTYSGLGTYQYLVVTAQTGTLLLQSVSARVDSRQFSMTGMSGQKLPYTYKFAPTDGSKLELPVFGFTTYGAYSVLAGGPNGLGIYETGSANNYQISLRHYVQLDLSDYQGVWVTLNIVGSGEVAIYGNKYWGGYVGSGDLLFKGPAAAYTYSGYAKYRYLSITTVSGYVSLNNVVIGCTVQQIPTYAPTTTFHQWKFQDIMGPVYFDYQFLASDFSNLPLKVFGWHYQSAGAMLYGNPNGLGIQNPGASSGSVVDNQHYVQFDFGPYLGQHIYINLIGMTWDTNVLIYQSNLFGGVIGKYGQYLIYNGSAAVIQNNGFEYKGAYRYVSVYPSKGSVVVSSIGVGLQTILAPVSYPTAEPTPEPTQPPVPVQQPVPQPVEVAPVPQPVEQPTEPAPVPQPVSQPTEPAPVPQPVSQPTEPAPVSQPVAPAPRKSLQCNALPPIVTPAGVNLFNAYFVVHHIISGTSPSDFSTQGARNGFVNAVNCALSGSFTIAPLKVAVTKVLNNAVLEQHFKSQEYQEYIKSEEYHRLLQSGGTMMYYTVQYPFPMSQPGNYGQMQPYYDGLTAQMTDMVGAGDFTSAMSQTCGNSCVPGASSTATPMYFGPYLMTPSPSTQPVSAQAVSPPKKETATNINLIIIVCVLLFVFLLILLAYRVYRNRKEDEEEGIVDPSASYFSTLRVIRNPHMTKLDKGGAATPKSGNSAKSLYSEA